MVSYEEYCQAVQVIKEYKLQLETDLDKLTTEVNDLGKFASVTSETKMIETNCSVRLWNLMRNYFLTEYDLESYKFYNEIRVSDLSKISLSKFSKRRNAGKGTIEELQELCFYAGVNLQP
jgi:hypothetical protein